MLKSTLLLVVTNLVVAGSRIKVRRYHYNDMVSVKLNESGDLAWARNINKTEVTQGDGCLRFV